MCARLQPHVPEAAKRLQPRAFTFAVAATCVYRLPRPHVHRRAPGGNGAAVACDVLRHPLEAPSWQCHHLPPPAARDAGRRVWAAPRTAKERRKWKSDSCTTTFSLTCLMCCLVAATVCQSWLMLRLCTCSPSTRAVRAYVKRVVLAAPEPTAAAWPPFKPPLLWVVLHGYTRRGLRRIACLPSSSEVASKAGPASSRPPLPPPHKSTTRRAGSSGAQRWRHIG